MLDAGLLLVSFTGEAGDVARFDLAVLIRTVSCLERSAIWIYAGG